MIFRPIPWREVEPGMTVAAPDGSIVVAPGPWPSDAAAVVVLVDEIEAVANLRAAGFIWDVLEVLS